jgi:predicted Rossmann fold nucleotide-binding protein DprA/Smf involved in DNA uptake
LPVLESLKEYKKPITEGRLLILAPFDRRRRRNTSETASVRNRFVAALADQILVAYAVPKSKTEGFCREILNWEKPLYTLEGQADASRMSLGAKPLSVQDILN